MNTTVQDLKSIVDRVAREGALTPDAIKQFGDLQERLETAEAELAKAKDSRDAHSAQAQRLLKDVGVLTERVTAADKELTNYRTREFEFTLQQRLIDSERERRHEMRSIVSEVFKNFETARAFTKMVPMPPQYQGGPPTYGTESQTDIEKRQPDSNAPVRY